MSVCICIYILYQKKKNKNLKSRKKFTKGFLELCVQKIYMYIFNSTTYIYKNKTYILT